MDNSVGIDCGSGGRAGWRGEKGKNWDNCNSINNKIFKLKKSHYCKFWPLNKLLKVTQIPIIESGYKS